VFVESQKLSDTDRGSGGFGHTGIWTMEYALITFQVLFTISVALLGKKFIGNKVKL
jgi:hypothetical protein